MLIPSEKRPLRTRQGPWSRELQYHSKQESGAGLGVRTAHGRAPLGRESRETHRESESLDATLTPSHGHSLNILGVPQLNWKAKPESETKFEERNGLQ